jgi:hypothetical protein
MTSSEVKEEEQAFPWTHPEVVGLHKLFDQEFEQTRSQKDGEALLQRFFGPNGLVEGKLQEWQGKDVECNDVMRVAFELHSFTCFVFTCIFFNEFPEELVKEWWQDPGMRSWASEQAFLEAPVKKIRAVFDEEASSCKSMLDLESLREKYLSPEGVISREFSTLRTLNPKQQLAVGAELFSLKSYIDYALFAIEYSAKVETWTTPEVRVLQYQFERELKACTSDEEFLGLEKRYLGEEGVIASKLNELKRKRGEKKAKHVEELGRMKDALQSFFSSHSSEKT